MAIVNNVTVDNGKLAKSWKIPSGGELKDTFVPRGMMVFLGTIPVAALAVGDELQLRVSLTFQESYQYVLKSIAATFISDDQTSDMDLLGSIEWATPTGSNPLFEFNSPGTTFRGTTLVASNTYQLQPHTPRPLMNSGDILHLNLSNMTGDSTAGDLRWYCECLIFDQEQVLTWPVNTPQPVICY